MALKKVRSAVALKYDKNTTPAPTVIASGKGRLADKIVELALENKIPVQNNPLLAESLSALQIGEHIPAELYEAVAQLLVYILHADKLLGEVE